MSSSILDIGVVGKYFAIFGVLFVLVQLVLCALQYDERENFGSQAKQQPISHPYATRSEDTDSKKQK
jgi:hypothetical protein